MAGPQTVEKPMVLERAAFLASRLLNHSRFPDGRAHGFAAPLRVALGLRPKCPQGTRFPARLSGARNARVACVRRKDGRCHSERSKGRDPLTLASGDPAHTAHSAGGRSRRPHVRSNFFPQKRLTRRKDGAIIPASNAEGGRAGMKAARMDHSSAYYFTFSFTFARKALLRCAV